MVRYFDRSSVQSFGRLHSPHQPQQHIRCCGLHPWIAVHADSLATKLGRLLPPHKWHYMGYGMLWLAGNRPSALKPPFRESAMARHAWPPVVAVPCCGPGASVPSVLDPQANNYTKWHTKLQANMRAASGPRLRDSRALRCQGPRLNNAQAGGGLCWKG